MAQFKSRLKSRFKKAKATAATIVVAAASLAVIALTWLQFRFVERHVHYG